MKISNVRTKLKCPLKKLISLVLIFILSINSFAAVVSDNDGSAFITKAEFDSLKNNFQSQIDSYNQSIDSKIDGAIASYLAGIKLSNTQEIFSVLNDTYSYLKSCTENFAPANNWLPAYGTDEYLWTRIPTYFASWSFIGTKNFKNVLTGTFDESSATFDEVVEKNAYANFSRTTAIYEGKGSSFTGNPYPEDYTYDGAIKSVVAMSDGNVDLTNMSMTADEFWTEIGDCTAGIAWKLDSFAKNSYIATYSKNSGICACVTKISYDPMSYSSQVVPIYFKNDLGGNAGFIPLNYSSYWHESQTQNVDIIDNPAAPTDLIVMWHDAPTQHGLITATSGATKTVSFALSDNLKTHVADFYTRWKLMLSQGNILLKIIEKTISGYTGAQKVPTLTFDQQYALQNTKITGRDNLHTDNKFYEHFAFDPIIVPFAFSGTSGPKKFYFDPKKQTKLNSSQISAAGITRARLDWGIPLFHIEKDGTLDFTLDFRTTSYSADTTNIYDCWFTKGPVNQLSALYSVKPSNCCVVDGQAANGSVSVKTGNKITIKDVKKDDVIYINFKKNSSTDGGIIKLPVTGNLTFDD